MSKRVFWLLWVVMSMLQAAVGFIPLKVAADMSLKAGAVLLSLFVSERIWLARPQENP